MISAGTGYPLFVNFTIHPDHKKHPNQENYSHYDGVAQDKICHFLYFKKFIKPSMVGAQKAINMASSLFPVRKRYSETMIMESTTSSIMKLMAPIFPIKFFNMFRTSSTIPKLGIILLQMQLKHLLGKKMVSFHPKKGG